MIKLEKSDTFKEIIFTVLVILLINLPFFFLAEYLGIVRSFINIDYFISFFFLIYGYRYLYIVSFIIISLVDFLQLFGQIFPVIRLADLFYLLKFSAISSTTYQVYGIIILLSVLSILFINIQLRNKISKVSLLVVFNVLIVALAIINNSVDSSKKPTNFWKPDKEIINSSLISYINYYNKSFIGTANLEGYAFQQIKVVGASEPLWEKTEANKILFIISESWGVPYDSKIQEDILSPLLNLSTVKKIQQQNFSFKGYTISGELRELCHKSPTHFNMKSQIEGFEDCLPHRYKSEGYKTIAIHGALGLMYDRQDWYPRAGFEKLMFRDRSLNLPNSFCYSFPGNCDKDIMPKIREQFEQNEKTFLYWLTLNTHSIYDERDLETDLFNCELYNINGDSASCRNLKLHKQFFYYLANMLQSDVFLGTKVVIVGDHEPPIISSEHRIFEENIVPSITFDIQ